MRAASQLVHHPQDCPATKLSLHQAMSKNMPCHAKNMSRIDLVSDAMMKYPAQAAATWCHSTHRAARALDPGTNLLL